ncbi:hypothetical protein L596_002209 [Steinernema carpocapsae]|uniref:Uncharacterized protein n=1 Tax=Steinernema carpocapsae TaxID=34508 RepID=A0A4U8USI5_STECR|nr:hypothetical protein L596_002209 [Steinernema carpocapsae]
MCFFYVILVGEDLPCMAIYTTDKAVFVCFTQSPHPPHSNTLKGDHLVFLNHVIMPNNMYSHKCHRFPLRF